MLLIQMWYGDPSNPRSQEKADEDYAHLVEAISSEYGGMRFMIDEFFIFDEEEDFPLHIFFLVAAVEVGGIDIWIYLLLVGLSSHAVIAY